MSKIGWTDVTWNPVTGCSHVSPGCDICYAETLSLRRGWSKKPWTARNAAENVVLHPDRLEQPLHWRKPRMAFVNSMSDLFHEEIPDEFIDQIFAVMTLAPQHVYQALTKRPERMRSYFTEPHGGYSARERISLASLGLLLDNVALLKVLPDRQGMLSTDEGIKEWPIPCVWLGVSVEDQRRADERIPILLDTPAAVRWLSCEPLLGPIDFPLYCAGSVFWSGLHWIVVGGETGPGHRPMEIEWLEYIVNQCGRAGVPVFVKQDSGPRPGKQGRIPDRLWALKQFPKTLEVTA